MNKLKSLREDKNLFEYLKIHIFLTKTRKKFNDCAICSLFMHQYQNFVKIKTKKSKV